ncbi:hypothetical protein CHS0354_030712 [Potamilus streckersoni]|uniref:Uncharacterized protein n=1 Tax=Potamilus streckersoni TaxID=2493646 RepID=A0AAE0SNN1_9BIVA|nr:hypothetical protein CHS0354_030712 [Potamilus streckersoni]
MGSKGDNNIRTSLMDKKKGKVTKTDEEENERKQSPTKSRQQSYHEKEHAANAKQGENVDPENDVNLILKDEKKRKLDSLKEPFTGRSTLRNPFGSSPN